MRKYYRWNGCSHTLFELNWYKSWYGLEKIPSWRVKKHFLTVGLANNLNPSPFVNTSWLQRNLINIEFLELIFNPCAYIQIKTHPLIDTDLYNYSRKNNHIYHHGSLNLNNWITETPNIKHSMFAGKRATLSPFEFRENSIIDFYPVAGNCLEYENKIIFDHGDWNLEFIVNHLKYNPQSG